MKIRSAKQLVSHLLQHDEHLGPFEDHCNVAAPESVPQDLKCEDSDVMPNEHAYETALDILERRAQRVDACSEILRQQAVERARNFETANNNRGGLMLPSIWPSSEATGLAPDSS